MMKRFYALLLTLYLLLSFALAEESRPPLRLGGPMAGAGYWKEHNILTTSPDYGWDNYMTIAQQDNAPDFYGFHTAGDDFLAPKNAGLLADLSSSEIIQASTERLRPDIRRLVTTEDGKIIGLPGRMGFVMPLPVYWRQDAWDVVGFTKEESPKSYTELLDFLEKWMERARENAGKNICVADTFGSNKDGYVHWLLDILISTWEMQQYQAGEVLNFNTPEFIALLHRTQDIGLRLEKTEPSEKKRQNMLQLFENYNGGSRYNDGREYGLSHTIPFRITGDQPELMRGIAAIAVVRADSPWLNEIIGCLEDDLKGAAPIGEGNADLYRDVLPRKNDPKISGSPSTVTAGYLADLDNYTGTICFAPMTTFTMYEGALMKFREGQLSAEKLAAQISQPKRNPN